MSIDAKLTRKERSKKDLSLKTILLPNLIYGCFDEAWRLNKGEHGDSFVCFHRYSIGRGIQVFWDPKENRELELHLALPACKTELHSFFAMVSSISRRWGADVTIDGENVNAQSVIKMHRPKKEAIRSNELTLAAMCRSLLDGEQEAITLISALHPLHMGPKEARRFLGDRKEFDRWLHEKQSLDAFYAAPSFYRSLDGKTSGRYVLTDDCRSIFPHEPSVPFGITGLGEDTQLECDEYEVVLYSNLEDKVLGTLEYEQFLERLPEELLSYYDAACFLVDGVGLADLKALSRA